MEKLIPINRPSLNLDSKIGEIASKTWVQEYIKEYLDGLATTSPPELPECKHGPIIKKVTIKGKRIIEVLFDGVEILSIKPEVLNKENKSIVETQTFVPKNNIPQITITEDLKDEIYLVKFTATLCNGESVYYFNGLTGKQVLVPNPCIGNINKIEVIKDGNI